MRLALIGKKGHGKDTFANIIQQKDNYYKIFHFAGRLKQGCSSVFNIPEEIFHDANKKETLFDEPIPLDNFLNELKEEFKLDIKPHKLVAKSPREILQYVGTNYIRDANPNYWVSYLSKKITAASSCVIPDMRFKNESIMFRAKDNSHIIKIIRIDAKNNTDFHISEMEMEKIVPNYTIGTRTGDFSIMHLAAEAIANQDKKTLSVIDYNFILEVKSRSKSKNDFKEQICSYLSYDKATVIADYYYPNTFFFKKAALGPEAKDPYKVHYNDSGFDLQFIYKIKEDDNFVVYDTGIQVAPPAGIYFDMVARSSLHKKGYMLANNVGVIDNEYRGNIMAVLYKLPGCEELELPFRGVQLIPRTLITGIFQEVDDLENTQRGSGGFGSTNRRK